MAEKRTKKIPESYPGIYCVPLGTFACNDDGLEVGKITVLLESDENFSVDGNYQKNGLLNGMAKLYSRLELKAGDEFVCVLPASVLSFGSA